MEILCEGSLGRVQAKKTTVIEQVKHCSLAPLVPVLVFQFMQRQQGSLLNAGRSKQNANILIILILYFCLNIGFPVEWRQGLQPFLIAN